MTKTSAQPLTTIVPLDPIWVRFKVSEAEYLGSGARATREQSQTLQTPLRTGVGRGSVYPYEGHVQNAVNQVDSEDRNTRIAGDVPESAST